MNKNFISCTQSFVRYIKIERQAKKSERQCNYFILQSPLLLSNPTPKILSRLKKKIVTINVNIYLHVISPPLLPFFHIKPDRQLNQVSPSITNFKIHWGFPFCQFILYYSGSLIRSQFNWQLINFQSSAFTNFKQPLMCHLFITISITLIACLMPSIIHLSGIKKRTVRKRN